MPPSMQQTAAGNPIACISANGKFSCYSVLKLFTGFAIAALIAWKLTVINVMARDSATTKK
jgi:hypothetical protein